MTRDVLTLYALLNGAVIASYVAFRLGVEALSRSRGPVPFRAQLFWARGLLLGTLVAPLAVPLLPAPPLPSFPDTWRLQEMSEVLLEAVPANVRDAVVPQRSRASKKPRALRPERAVEWWVAAGAILTLLGAIVLAGLRLFKSMRALSTILFHAIDIKRVGRVSLVASSEVTVPFAARWRRRSWIVVPAELPGSFRDYQIAVRHEIQHHRQRDTTWALGMEFLRLLFPLNPFFTLWNRKLSELQEFSCDEALLGRRRISSHDYGSCLVRVAEAALGHRSMLVGTTGMATDSRNPVYFKSFLRRRIEMLGQPKARCPRRATSLFVGTCVALFTAAVCFGTQQVLGKGKPSEALAHGSVAVDPEIQKIADRALEGAIAGHAGAYAFAVVADPHSGRILAVANKDNRSQPAPGAHWALSLRSEPASIVKPLTVAAAVEQGLTDIDERHDCENGQYVVDGKVFKDWKPFETLTTGQAVVQSSNICTIKVAQRLGAPRLAEMFQQFGFGAGGTAEAFPEAVSGSVPMPGQMSDALYVATLGTGFSGLLTTPLEVVQAYGAIANGGTLLVPQAQETVDPTILRRVLSEETARAMRAVLAEVMVQGTGTPGQGMTYRLAGKTGTAWSAEPGSTGVGSFAGFGPAEAPRIVVYTGVQDPSVQPMTGGYASTIFRRIAEEVLLHLGVSPTAPSER